MSSARSRFLFPLLLAFVIAVAWWLPFWSEPPGRDQSLFLAESAALLDGGSLYTEIWEHKPPAILVAYALAQAVAGRGGEAAHLLHWVAGGITALLLVLLVRRHTSSWLAVGAGALLYILYHAGPAWSGFWGTAQAEVLMEPFLAAALFLLVEPGGGRTRFLGAGLAVAALAGFKYPAILAALLVLPALVRQAREPGPPRAALPAPAAFMAGLLAPVLAWLAYLALGGRLDAFWTATVTFNLMHGAVAQLSRTTLLGPKVFYAGGELLPLYAATAVGALLLLVPRVRQDAASRGATRLLLWGALAWLLALGQVFWQGKFWDYHYRVVLVPLAIMASAGLAIAHAALARTRLRGAGAAVLCAAGLAILLAPYGRLVYEYGQEHRLRLIGTDGDERRAVLATYRWGGTDYDFLETLEVAKRVKAETRPEDRIFVWGFEPGVYVFAERRPATRFFYDYPLMPRFTAVHERYVTELMADLEAHPPALILVVSGDANDIEDADSVTQLLRMPALHAFVAARYEPAWRQGDFWVLRRRAHRGPS